MHDFFFRQFIERKDENVTISRIVVQFNKMAEGIMHRAFEGYCEKTTSIFRVKKIFQPLYILRKFLGGKIRRENSKGNRVP